MPRPLTRPLALALLLLPAWAGAATVVEDQPFALSRPALVGYGAGAKWTAKLLQPGAYRCDNATFGDPNYGVVKACIGYAINAVVCGIDQGANAAVSYTTKGAWRSQWCPADTGPALHIVAGKWADAPGGVMCYLEAKGSSTEKLAKCAPNSVTSPDLAPTWAGDALRIFNTRLN